MTHSHVDTIALLYPPAAEKTFLLREFDETLEPFEKDISDPIGSSYEVYVNCRNQIEQGIASLLKFMEQHEILSAPQAAKTVPTTNFALGADHGGYELKEALKQHLQQRGLSVTDFGAKSKEPADDYPDFAQPVAQAVAAGRAELGLLVCTSGVGMSIAANKVPGVRAALVADERTAALARQHNDANVLCLSGKNTPPEPGRKILDAFIAAKFEGGRHERRVDKMDVRLAAPQLRLRNVDPAVAEAIEHERLRQQENIELIASRKFRQPGGPGSARLRAHEQIRRGLCRRNAGMAAAKTLTPSSNWRLTARKNCSARNTPTSSRTPAARRTWPSISPC